MRRGFRVRRGRLIDVLVPAAARRHLFLRSLSAVPAAAARDRTFNSQPFDPVVIIKMGSAADGDGGWGGTRGCGGKNEKMVGF